MRKEGTFVQNVLSILTQNRFLETSGNSNSFREFDSWNPAPFLTDPKPGPMEGGGRLGSDQGGRIDGSS